MPPKKSTKPKKTKPKKTKPKTTTKQKQSQKQIVNQIVKVYLDERKKSKRTRSTPQKRNVSSGRQNINISPILSSPLNEMYSYRQPNNTNPITDLLNKLNAISNKTTGEGNRLGGVMPNPIHFQEQGELPRPEQNIYQDTMIPAHPFTPHPKPEQDIYQNTNIPANPLIEPRTIQEMFPSLDPHFTDEPIKPIVGDVMNYIITNIEREREEMTKEDVDVGEGDDSDHG